MNYVKVKILPTPHNMEFKYIGRLIFDINYMNQLASPPHIGMEWLNSKGQVHRENGPAMRWDNRYQYWCRYGKLHREDGPAVILLDGSHVWLLNGISYSEENFKKEIRRRNELCKHSSFTNTL